MLLMTEGFDKYEQTIGGGVTELLLHWDGPSATTSYIDFQAGRFGGRCLNTHQGGSAYVTSCSLGAKQTLIFGMAIRFASINTYNNPFFETFDNLATLQVRLRKNTNGTITALRGSTELATSTWACTAGTWYFYEIKIGIDDAAGVVIVKAYPNLGTTGTEIINYTGDTRNAGNANIDRFKIVSPEGNGVATYFDDIRVCDTTGATCNDFLGNTRVDTFLPDADGTYAEFTCSTGTSHFDLVDERPVSMADYNSATTIGQRDTYSHATAAGIEGVIFAVQASGCLLRAAGGTVGATGLVRSGTTPADRLASPSYAVSLPTAKYFRSIYELEPVDAVAWTPAKIDAAEFGIKVV